MRPGRSSRHRPSTPVCASGHACRLLMADVRPSRVTRRGRRTARRRPGRLRPKSRWIVEGSGRGRSGRTRGHPVAERPNARLEGDLAARGSASGANARVSSDSEWRAARRPRCGPRRPRPLPPPGPANRGRRSRPARPAARSPPASRGSAASRTVSSISRKPPGWAHRLLPGAMPRRISTTSPRSVTGRVVTTSRGLT